MLASDRFVKRFEEYQGGPLTATQMTELQRLNAVFEIKDDDIAWGVVAGLLVCASMVSRANAELRADFARLTALQKQLSAAIDKSVNDVARQALDIEKAALARMEETAKRLAQPSEDRAEQTAKEASHHMALLQAKNEVGVGSIQVAKENFERAWKNAATTFKQDTGNAASLLREERDRTAAAIREGRTLMIVFANQQRAIAAIGLVGVIIGAVLGGMAHAYVTRPAASVATSIQAPWTNCDPRQNCVLAK